MKRKDPMSNPFSMSRRELFTSSLPSISASLLGVSPLLSLLACKKDGKLTGSSMSAKRANQDRKFIFVFCAMGGASINDSFLARNVSEIAQGRGDTSILNVFPDQLVKRIEGSELRAVDLAADAIGALPFPVNSVQSRFLNKYYQDIMAVTVSGTSVAHSTAQTRSITGNNAWNGRTLQEAVAVQYGKDLLLPNINMGTIGFAENGIDTSLPTYAVANPIPDPAFFPFSLHGFKGIQGAPSSRLMAMARQLRNEKLEPQTKMMQTHSHDRLIEQWIRARGMQRRFEDSDLINRLNPFADSKDLPFADFGLSPNADGPTLRGVFPDIGADPLQTQALLAYLCVTGGLTCAATFGIGMNVSIDGKDAEHPLLMNTPTAFDYSHNAHRSTQALLWHKVMDTLDRLITLLKATEYGDGQSYWDRSLIYIATEFGRDKKRKANTREFPTGHDTNNGVVIISPRANGNTVLGGVDPKSLNTFGFDPETGDPQPGRTMSEREIYAGILHSLDVDTKGSGLPDMKAMRRKS